MHGHMNVKFGNCYIGRGSQNSWPSRSPHLTPLDFCLNNMTEFVCQEKSSAAIWSGATPKVRCPSARHLKYGVRRRDTWSTVSVGATPEVRCESARHLKYGVSRCDTWSTVWVGATPEVRCESVRHLKYGVRLQNIHEIRRAKLIVSKRAKFWIAATGGNFEMQAS